MRLKILIIKGRRENVIGYPAGAVIHIVNEEGNLTNALKLVYLKFILNN